MDQENFSTRPTLRQIEYALAVARSLHFGRAAKSVHVSQPGLSAQVRSLEDQLGVRLFERDKKRVRPTPEGAALLPRLAAVLRAADELVEAAREFHDPLRGTLRLGVIPTVAPYLLPLVLPDVRKELPDLKLVLREDRTERIVRALRDGALDACLLALPEAGDDLEAAWIAEEPFLLVLPKGHALARGKSPLHASALEGESVLLLEEGHCLRDQALAVCDRAGAVEEGGAGATSLPTLVQMVANGLGVTLLPRLAVPVETRAGRDLVVRAFVRPQPSRVLGLVWRKSSGRGPTLRRLATILAARAKRLISSAKT